MENNVSHFLPLTLRRYFIFFPMENIVTEKSRQIGIILSGSLAGFMVLLDGNIVNIALPAIGRYFDIGTTQVVKITVVYLLVLAGVMISVGKLAGKMGIKRTFMLGFSIFTLSSLACGLSGSFQMLVLARAVQALGGAMLIVTALTLVTTFIPAEKRGWAFGILTPVNSLGVIVGAPLGGLITGYLNWHWIFLVNVPIGIVALFVANKVIPGDTSGKGKPSVFRGFDYAGAILSFAGLAVLVFILDQGRKFGWTSPVVLIGLTLVVIFLSLFLFAEKKHPDPLLELGMFRDRNFSLGIVASIMGYGLMAGNGVLMPFYVEYILHIPVQTAGFILMIFALVFSMLSPFAGRKSDRMSKTRLTSTGMFLATLTSLFFVVFLSRTNLVFVIVYLAMMGISYSMFITPNNNLIMSLAKGERQSVTSSVFRLSTNLGQLIGVLVMESMFTLCLPKSSQPTAQQLKQATHETLLTGFQYSYIGGAILVFLAMVTSRFIKEKGIAGKSEATEIL